MHVQQHARELHCSLRLSEHARQHMVVLIREDLEEFHVANVS